MNLHSQGIKIGKSFRFDFPHLRDSDKPFDMIWVPPGTFTMGSPPDEVGRAIDGENQFEVTLTKGFWLSKYPVTFAHWYAVLHCISIETVLNRDFTGLEVEVEEKLRDLPRYANRYEALIFCVEMNQRIFGHVLKDIKADGYRFNLPTEAQWEYACRAGTTTRFYNGDSMEDLDKIAWHLDNAETNMQPVGEKLPNNWGFYDMLGNVSEWCLDEFRYYPKNAATDWIGKNNPDGLYANRGGNVEDSVSYCRSASRGYNWALTQVPIWGFRLCLSKIDYIHSW